MIVFLILRNKSGGCALVRNSAKLCVTGGHIRHTKGSPKLRTLHMTHDTLQHLTLSRSAALWVAE